MPGSVVFSDAHSSYQNLSHSKSQLTKYGFYHFWINHGERYVHEKFPFVNTGSIETHWHLLKTHCKGINISMKEQAINEYCNTFSLFQMVKKSALYEFMIRRVLIQYFTYIVQDFIRMRHFEEDFVPKLFDCDLLQENTLTNRAFCAKTSLSSNDLKRHIIQHNEDLTLMLESGAPRSMLEIDPSIIRLYI